MAFFLATSNDATQQMTILLRSWNRIPFATADRKSGPNINILTIGNNDATLLKEKRTQNMKAVSIELTINLLNSKFKQQNQTIKSNQTEIQVEVKNNRKIYMDS